MNPPKNKLTKDQIVFAVEAVLTGAWDRIDSALPDVATDAGCMADWLENQTSRREMIHGQVSVVAATLPIIYATLTDDGMGIGDFNQFETFENQVENYIRRKTDPKINFPGNHLVYPDSHYLAKEFVEDYLSDYLRNS